MNVIDYADLYAERAHLGQVRKYNGSPYIEHPRRVFLILAGLNRTKSRYDPKYTDKHLAIALLHDTIEDTGVTWEDLRRDFDWMIADGVRSLTNASKAERPELNRAQRKEQDRARLKLCNDAIQSIKLADRIDNLKDMEGCDEGFWRIYREESRLLLQDLTRADKRLRQELTELLVDPEPVTL